MKKTNYFLNFIRSYRNIFFKVILFEIFYSIRFGSIIPRMKIQNNNSRTDTIPCIYYFIHEISKFVKRKEIKSLIDIGSGYGRIVKSINKINNIKTIGIEFDKEIHQKMISQSYKNVYFYNGDVFKFNLKKLNPGCFVLVDPFKKNNDKIRFLNKLIKEFRNKNKYLILINFNNFKLKKNFKLLKSITGSHSRSIKIYKIL